MMNVGIEVVFTTEAAYFVFFIMFVLLQGFTLIPNMSSMMKMWDLTKGTWVFGMRWHCCRINSAANAEQIGQLLGGGMM